MPKKLLCNFLQYGTKIFTGLPTLFSNVKFSLKVAFITYIKNIFPSRSNILKQRKTVNQFFCSLFADIIKKYDNTDWQPQECNGKIPVWFCWFTGLDNAPPVIKLCYEQLKNSIPENAEIIVITQDNMHDYADISDNVRNKFESAVMCAAHFSDCLRFSLLKKYGGLWVDATLFVSEKIDESILKQKLFCLKTAEREKNWREISDGKWALYMWGGQAGNPLFCYVCDALELYWEKFDEAIEYTFLDHILLLAYNNIKSIHEMVDEQAPLIGDYWLMGKCMNLAFSDDLEKKIINNGIFNKLTYKTRYNDITENGEDTLYGHYLKQYNLQP